MKKMLLIIFVSVLATFLIAASIYSGIVYYESYAIINPNNQAIEYILYYLVGMIAVIVTMICYILLIFKVFSKKILLVILVLGNVVTSLAYITFYGGIERAFSPFYINAFTLSLSLFEVFYYIDKSFTITNILTFFFGNNVLLQISFIVFLVVAIKKPNKSHPPFTKKQLEYINDNYQPKDS